jgi:hypothetical protein
VALRLSKILDQFVRGDLDLVRGVLDRNDEINGNHTHSIELKTIPKNDLESNSKELEITTIESSASQKRKRDEEYEILERQLELEERRISLEGKKQLVMQNHIDFNRKLFDDLIINGSNPVIKENAKLAKENMLSMISQQLCIPNSTSSLLLLETSNQPFQVGCMDESLLEFSVSTESLAILKRNKVEHYWKKHPNPKKSGLRRPEIGIGRILHKKYREKYGHKNNNTREQKNRDGISYRAKVYQRKDLDLLMCSLKEYFEVWNLK